jgi:type IV pilus assembly protein PilY1
MRRALVLLPIAAVFATVLVVRHEASRAVTGGPVSCFGDLNANTYTSGFQASDFSVLTAAKIVAGGPPTGGLQLDTGLAPLDSQRIILPFDQNLAVKYVYRSAAASQTLGWFYLDQIAAYLDKPATDPTAKLKLDTDGVPLFFKALWKITAPNTVPDIIVAPNYSDGGTYDHIHNFIESLWAPGKGGLIFKLCDDDADTSSFPGSGVTYAPATDVSTTVDGIPDYDVNGNSILDEVADRTVDLGLIQGNREIVFVAMNYRDNTLNNYGLGLAGVGSHAVRSIPWFTKDMLNPDQGARAAGTVIRKTAIGCARDDASCYTARGGDLGWLDPATLARLSDPANVNDYNQLDITGDTTVRTIAVDAAGNVPHWVAFSPDSDPNRWLLALDNQPEYAGVTDADYDDVVFLIKRTNGGSVQSNLISAAIPVGQLGNSVISKIRIRFNASFPAPGCTGVSDAEIRIYYSVDNKVTWNQVSFPSKTTGDLTIDVLGSGQVGNQLFWRADFISSSQFCQPVLNSLNIGYEAVEHGEYKFSASIPLSNMAFSGSVETPPFPAPEPAATRNDFAFRGHFRAERLYDPTNPSATSLATEWDAGAQLAVRAPATRAIYTSVSGATTSFVATNSSLYDLVLPSAIRNTLSSGSFVYDFTGEGAVDDIDAKFLIEWTRGWEYPASVTMTPAQATLARAWKLGPVHNSSPAIAGPPPRPIWIDQSAAPAAMVSAHNTFRTANATRQTVALVGAQDGMLHAFDAGQFRYGNDPSCAVQLSRGCFAGATDAARYGNGDELWAWIPPSQLSSLKANAPGSRNYAPTANPPAEIDGSISVEDVYAGGTFKTIAFASLGRRQPYVTAVDITTSTPAAIWADDFTDSDFNGTELSPSVGLTAVAGGKFLMVLTSGLSSAPDDLYLYLVDALTGITIGGGKRKLNTGGASAQAYGFAGYPSLIDANQDGLIDRVYAVDTSGRIFKYDLTSNQHCVIAQLGETVYSGMAVLVGGNSTAPTVKLYVGGAPNPDGTGSCASDSDCTAPDSCQNNVCSTQPVTYHLRAYQDSDLVGTCTSGGASLVYSVTLPPGQRLWAAPFVANDTAFYATAGARSQSVCLTAPGTLYELSTLGDGAGGVYGGGGSAIALGGSPVSSLRVYDGHALVNTVGGQTTIIGGAQWNNTPSGSGGVGGMNQVLGIPTLIWNEQ